MAALAENIAGATAPEATTTAGTAGAPPMSDASSGSATDVLETLKTTPRKEWWKPILALSGVIPTQEDGEEVLCNFDTSEYEKLLVFKKIINKETDLAQYRVHARVRAEIDVFSGMLIDTAYRKTWDESAVSIDDLSVHDDEHGCYSRVVRWVERIGFMFWDRDYVYHRFYKIHETEQGDKVCLCYTDDTLVENPPEPLAGTVRAKKFFTVMAARQVKGLEEPCVEYVLVSSTDMDMPIPTWLLNYVVDKVLPSSSTKMGEACAKYKTYLEAQKKEQHQSADDASGFEDAAEE